MRAEQGSLGRAIARIVLGVLASGWGMGPLPASAEEVTVALATNFLKPMEEIAAAFERESGHRVLLSSGSTGKLYAQITHGAPFDLFLAADQARPKRLEEEGLAVAGTRFTYAVGRLTLWSRDRGAIPADGAVVLREGRFSRLAIANPKTAPFGAAAIQVMETLGVADALRPKLVQGENIGQAFQFVYSGNAEVGFVSLSQVLDPRIDGAGSRWDVPSELYDPLKMDVVLLERGRGKPAALALRDYLTSEAARAVIERYGYAPGR